MGNERRYSLDALRIIATILIIFHHYQQVIGGYFEGHINFWNGRFYFGYIVEFFFSCLAILCIDMLKKSTRAFHLKSFLFRACYDCCRWCL